MSSSCVLGRSQTLPVRTAFGAYRSLPRGEYTWVIFDAVRREKTTISASVLLLKNEPVSRAVLVQLQQSPAE